jgi:virulence factor Mce-like protein
MRVALTGLVVVVMLTGCGGGDDHVVRAEFANASGLRAGSLVRVNGAEVGSVRKLRVTGRDTAVVELKLDHDVLPGAGARAAIRPANLLGEKFVDLTVGDRARPTTTIPVARTSTPVEIDDVLDVLDPTTRGRLGVLIGELGTSLDHRGRDLSAALKLMPGTVEDAGELFAQVASDTRVLERLLGEADRVAVGVAGDRRSLGALVQAGGDALAVPASRRAELARLLGAGPPALRQLRASLRRLDRTGTALRPAARGLRASAPALEQALRALPGFDAAAAPALDELTRSSPSLVRLGRGAAPVVRRLRPAANELRTLATDAEPLTGTLDTSVADLLGVMQNWALAIQTRDATSHVFRVSLSLTPDVLRALGKTVRDDGRRGRRPAAPPVTALRPSPPPAPAAPRLPAVLDKPVQQVKDSLKPLLDLLLKP